MQPSIYTLGEKLKVKLTLSTKRGDSFLLENHIDPSAINLMHHDWINKIFIVEPYIGQKVGYKFPATNNF
ncbi:12650_t:CDS:2 [Dentiscutata erythropus]|uniref:12650_t:CDS:1 n=1 Tax=Dentiscutata erythropus TaxID=1348616 RepID=A0A9N9FZJ1_9GLOM|nr:12650_t:CDS:2 [Dentiscutata erythropus]